MFIPWADAEKIILYSGYTSSGGQARYVAVQRREGAPLLPYGNEQVPWCLVPGAWRRGTAFPPRGKPSPKPPHQQGLIGPLGNDVLG